MGKAWCQEGTLLCNGGSCGIGIPHISDEGCFFTRIHLLLSDGTQTVEEGSLQDAALEEMELSGLQGFLQPEQQHPPFLFSNAPGRLTSTPAQ